MEKKIYNIINNLDSSLDLSVYITTARGKVVAWNTDKSINIKDELTGLLAAYVMIKDPHIPSYAVKNALKSSEVEILPEHLVFGDPCEEDLKKGDIIPLKEALKLAVEDSSIIASNILLSWLSPGSEDDLQSLVRWSGLVGTSIDETLGTNSTESSAYDLCNAMKFLYGHSLSDRYISNWDSLDLPDTASAEIHKAKLKTFGSSATGVITNRYGGDLAYVTVLADNKSDNTKVQQVVEKILEVVYQEL